MFRIRLHGRGGQGIKTAARVLGTALFREGLEVQDAPRYGAERRGAPIFAYVRAARTPIRERGPIRHPDLALVADASLLSVPSAAVSEGLTARSALLVVSSESASTWSERLGGCTRVFGLERSAADDAALTGSRCVGAACRMLGIVQASTLEAALREELAAFPPDVVATNVMRALAAFEELAPHAGCIAEGPEHPPIPDSPDWIELAREPAALSAPQIRQPVTTLQVPTGLWRTQRPVIDYARCNRCSWMCSTLCPDSAIRVDADRTPHIDYEHCKGCGICAGVCPPHAIAIVPEPSARENVA